MSRHLVSALAFVALLGCAPGPAASPTVGAIDHATGPADVVLRMEVGGGFVPIDFLITQAPSFTLYGNGTVVYQQADTRLGQPAGGRPMLPWLVGHMDESDVQALLQFALGTGMLADARDFYPALNVADAPDTIFTVNAGGVNKAVTVGALGMGIDDATDPDRAIRLALGQLASALGSFEARGANGELGEIKPYNADLYRAVLLEASGAPAVEPIAWPWPDLAPDAFVEAVAGGRREHLLTRDQVALLTDVPNGGHPGVFVSAPNGEVVQIALRPLLIDEMPAQGVRPITNV
jgi:hypothetical protein